MNQFNDLGLAAPLLKALAAEGYDHPTPIQIQAIPPVLEGRDLVGLAQTGTGKTAAFALPLLHRLNAERRHAGPRGARVLVLAPTRELAAQIGDSFRAYGKFIGLSTAVVFGGVPIGKQFRALERGVDILVATPGRLLDLVSQRACRLDSVEALVLDEADHMMDLGFIVPLKRIAKLLPKTRQTLFFSATMPPEIEDLSRDFIHEPVRVAVAPVSSTAERVDQVIIHVEHGKKQELLEDILRDPAISRALVFSRTKHGANRIAERLADARIHAEAIHGNKSQGQRERALEAFKKGKARLLIATEIAARGIDVENVTHVINFDLPDVPEQYVHRIGRTARAGAEGRAISFCAPDERINLRDIERLTKQALPVQEHALSLPAPQPGDRLPKRPPRAQRSNGRQHAHGHKHTHVREEAPRTSHGPRTDGPRSERTRAEGGRADRLRTEGHRADPHRADGHRGEGFRAERTEGFRADGPHRKSPGQKRAPDNAPDAKRGDNYRTDKPAHKNAPRDQGDRRDRKGNDVWSNSGQRQQQRPQKQRSQQQRPRTDKRR
ncbi:MAG: DEAD/DEAH box helicase [Hyphomonadaceae bacterium]